VLVRKISWGDRLLEGLRRAGIPAMVAGGRRFYAREEIETLLALLETMLTPQDGFARFAALRSSAIGFSDDALARRFLEADPDDDATLAELRAVERRLDALAARASSLSVPEFLELVCEDLALLTIFGLRPDGLARMESLRILVESADGLADAGLDTLPAFVRWLREQSSQAREGSLGEEDASAGDGVQISTMHKSKGLEYPIVILADLASGTPSTASVAFDRVHGRIEFRLSKSVGVQTALFEEVHALDRAREAAEEVRLLYVAMTRARDHLVLSWPEGTGGFLAGPDNELIRRVGCEPGAPAPADATDLRTVRVAELAPVPATERMVPLDLDRVPAPPSPVERPGPAEARRGRRVIPATRFVPAERIALPEERVRSGPRLGSWIHRALEIHRTDEPIDVALEAARAFVERRFARDEPGFAFDDDTRLVATAMFARIVRDPAVTAVWRAPNVQREVPFLLPVGDDFVSGTLDVLVIGSDGRLAIVDYKTEDLAGVSPDRAKERYRSQALVYAHAASRLGRRPVSEVRLLFLATDPVGVGSFSVDEEFLLEARAVLGRAVMR
jgi:ATP-dependent helicase/nuclease subunit A